MKRNKLAISITIGIVCFALVLTIFMQFKLVYQTEISEIDTLREEDLRTELASWKKKYEETEEKYEEVVETLKKYNEQSSSNSKTKKNLEEELENLELALGVTDVEGKGLIIRIEDPKIVETDYMNQDIEQGNQLVSSSELMIIVNFLKDAGAEAISINGNRVVNTTDFVNITASSYIKMNSQRISSPFEIKVIGDADALKSSLIGTGYVEKIKTLGQKITFTEKNNIQINKYNGNMETEYIKENK